MTMETWVTSVKLLQNINFLVNIKWIKINIASVTHASTNRTTTRSMNPSTYV